MGYYLDDSNNDETMPASAEEWSKPTPPVERPPSPPEPTDRWGSPITEKTTSTDQTRWGSKTTSPTDGTRSKKKSGAKWWVILIVILVVLCLCACLVGSGITVWKGILPKSSFLFPI
jgi:hypothetical protein